MGHYEQEQNYLAAEAAYTRRKELASLSLTPKFIFTVGSEFVVIGRNPEFADQDNPYGDIIAERFYMVATDEVGHQYRYGWEATPERAEAVFHFVAPEVSTWPLFRCIYGSPAYEQEGCERGQLVSEMETDLGADWMNHPQARNVVFAMGR